MKKSYKIEVDCANCAAKVEDAIQQIDGVNKATINFMTQKLILDVEDNKLNEVIKKAEAVGKKVDSDFEIYA